MAEYVHIDETAFLKGLRRVAKQIDGNAEALVAVVGEGIAKSAKSRAPKRTGQMADSIKSHPGRDRKGAYAEISVGPFYASMVEWGTKNMGAEPFFRPALKGAKGRISRQVRKLL